MSGRCSVCGVELTVNNARRYNGRWIGRCRSCESLANRKSHQDRVHREASRLIDGLDAAWDFVVWCSQQDYRGPMPEHVRRACDLLAQRHEDAS